MPVRSGPLRLFVLVAPAVGIGAWGAFYLRDLLLVLAAPGVPLDLKLRTPAGLVRFRADSYAFDWRRGVLRVAHPKLQGPQGGLLAQVDSVEIAGLTPSALKQPSVRVRARNLAARFVRLPSGRFEIENLLPKREGPSSNIPFSVDLEGARVSFVDLAGPRPWEQRILTDRVRVAGLGDDWLAASRVRLPDIGRVVLSVQGGAEGALHVNAQADTLRLARVLDHLVQVPPFRGGYPALREVGVGAARVSGPITLSLARGRLASLRAKLSGEARDVVYRNTYRADRIVFQAALTERGLSGSASATNPGVRADFRGNAVWSEGLRVAGHLNAEAESKAAIPAWAQKEVPAPLGFQGLRYDGWVAYALKGGYRARGDVRADAVSYGPDRVESPRLSVDASPRNLVARIVSGSYRGVAPRGTFTLDPQTRELRGTATAGNVNLARLAQRFKVKGVTGTASASATLAGDLAHPAVRLAAYGHAQVQPRPGTTLDLGRFTLVGGYRQDAFQLGRAVVDGPAGQIVALGGAVGKEGLDLRVRARGLRPGALLPDLSGVVNADLRVGGTLDDPRGRGRVEAYNILYNGETAPAAVANVVIDRNRATLTNVDLLRGTARATGTASYDFATGRIAGDIGVQGLQLAEFLGNDVAGLVSVTSLNVGGTVKHPVVSATLQGRDLVVQGIKIDSVEAKARLADGVVRVSPARVVAAGGTIDGSASYVLGTRRGVARLTTTSLAIPELLPDLTETVDVDGTVRATSAQVEFGPNGIRGSASGSLDGIVANGSRVGDGSWEVSTDGTVVRGQASIGRLLPTLRVFEVAGQYNLEKKVVDAELDARNARVSELIGASRRYLRDAFSEDRSALSTLLGRRQRAGVSDEDAPVDGFSGDLTTRIRASGPLSSLDLAVDTLTITDLAYRKPLEDGPPERYGTLTVNNLERHDGKWQVPLVEIQGPAGSVSLTGTAAEQGNLDLQARARDVRIAAFSPFVAGLGANTATLTRLDLAASGPTRNPRVTGSARVEKIGAPGADPDRTLSVDLEKISASRSEGLAVSGGYSVGGFEGAIQASAAITPDPETNARPLSGSVTVNPRSLTDLPLLASYIDAGRTKNARVQGRVEFGGDVARPTFQGGVSLTADQLGIRFPSGSFVSRVDNELQNLQASVSVTGAGRVQVKAGAASDAGGRFDLNASTGTFDLPAIAGGNVGGVIQSLFKSSLSGDLKVEDFRFRQSLPGGYVAATVSGSVPLGGTLNAPTLGTSALPAVFTVANANIQVPSLGAGSGTAAAPPINPSFNMEFALSTPATVRSATAEFGLTGDGSLRGTFTDPLALGNLVVQRGSIRLPGGNVRVDPGGTLDFTYRNDLAQQAAATLDVDLQGRTSVTASRPGEPSRRYDLTLDIQGNLLADQGLRIQTFSDPPDLTTNEALALLGQGQLFETLGSSATTDTERRLRDAITGFALPGLLNPITGGVARAFGLDYFDIEYDATSRTSLFLSRSLNNEFSVQYRQQIGAAAPGYTGLYDYRIVYNPRRLGGRFQRINFSLGADQDRPWKIAVEYGTRFGQRGRGSGAPTVISPP